LLRAERISKDRFFLEVSEAQACNAIYAGMKAVVENRGGTFVLDADTRSHIVRVGRWLIDPNGKPGLLFAGLCGNGKTTLALGLTWVISYLTERELGYDRRLTVKCVTAKELCSLCAASERFKSDRDRFRSIASEQMLLIDDMGEEAKEVTVFGMVHTPVVDILSTRYARQLMTVITTNLTPQQIEAKYGRRIYDRLCEMVLAVSFTNPSYRSR